MVSNRKIVTTGSKRVEPPDLQDAYRRAWEADAKIASERLERLAKAGGRGSTSNDAVNETQRIRNSGLTIERRAKMQCSSCGRLRLPDDLLAPTVRGNYGSRVCADRPECLDKAKRWARTPA